MGVPVVSRIGDRHASRVGATLLNAVGLGDLCAKNDDEFVASASALARDAIRRNTLSGTGLDSLRARMARSMLCDSEDYANRFTLMIEGLVREYDERLADEAS
jgi:predicted O-linked N-acetylglucosamine transferase (SPINDLY family)